MRVLGCGVTRVGGGAGLRAVVVARQVEAVRDSSGAAALASAVVADEPVWAIGTGVSASPAQARQVHGAIRAQVAALDRRFAAVAGRFPSMLETLTARADARARMLALQRALAQVPRVDARVLVLLWRLADRWGTVTPEGVQLPIVLTHDMLAKLVGARRPSVTTAVGALTDAGLIERVEGGFRLLGDPVTVLPEML